MTEHSPRDGLSRLESLIYRNLHTYVDPPSRAAQVGWGMFFTIQHHICAILTLHRERLCFSAGPNRRTLLEYSLYLAWLVDDGEAAVDVLNRKLLSNSKNLETQLTQLGHLDRYPEHARQSLAKTLAEQLPPHPDEHFHKTTHLMDEYDSSLKPYYAAESGFSHPSLISVGFFMKPIDDGVGLSQKPMPEEATRCVDFCLHLCSQSMLMFNELLIGKPGQPSSRRSPATLISILADQSGRLEIRCGSKVTPSAHTAIAPVATGTCSTG
jgi:hypothetical protein